MVLQIFIDYKMNGSSEWKTVEFLPKEYFDLDFEDDFELDSVPEFNHAIEYLDVEVEKISHTRIRINDNDLGCTKTITTTFWNKSRNFIIERIDKEYDSTPNYHLVITNILLQEYPAVVEIMRFKKIEGILELESHSFIRDEEDGSQSEKIVFPLVD